jgi:Ferritin-like domain
VNNGNFQELKRRFTAMNTPNEIEVMRSSEQSQSGSSRRSFLKGAALTGATTFAALGALSPVVSAAEQQEETDSMQYEHDHLKKGDRDILIAAQVAEALAVTTYSNIINISPFFKTIPDDDQGYLIGARQEEMSHYLLEQSVTDQFTPFTQFFYPKKMFSDAQTTLNILVTLEDAFIAAYLIGVRNFSTRNLRVTAARIMGIESDHRTLARVVGGDVTPQFGGPISSITGIQGVAESIAPPNNNGYERTLCWTSIDQALAALTPFVNFNAAKAAGFDTLQSFPFEPFNPILPNPLGDFVSFSGC